MRGVLKVRPHTKSVCVCGRGGGAVHFRSDIRKVGGGGGGQSTSGSIYEKWGGGGGNSLQVRYEKWGGGGGGDTFVWHKENSLPLIINGYNFDQGCAQALHS